MGHLPDARAAFWPDQATPFQPGPRWISAALLGSFNKQAVCAGRSGPGPAAGAEGYMRGAARCHGQPGCLARQPGLACSAAGPAGCRRPPAAAGPACQGAGGCAALPASTLPWCRPCAAAPLQRCASVQPRMRLGTWATQTRQGAWQQLTLAPSHPPPWMSVPATGCQQCPAHPRGCAAGVRSFTLSTSSDKSKPPRCTAVGLADGGSLQLEPPVVLAGSVVAWLGPLQAATQLAVKASIAQVRVQACAGLMRRFPSATHSSRVLSPGRPACG